jgi:hypothetical protein
MNIPKPSEINVYGSLDELCALSVFLGKTVDDAEALFRDNSMHCAELLVHMGPRARLYYVEAYLRYLASSSSRDDPGAASGLPSVVDALIESGVNLDSIRPALGEALQRINAEFARYAPDRMTQRIYRDVPREARGALRRLYAKSG